MKRIVILVKNNFINDRRVYNTGMSLTNHGYEPRIIALNSSIKMKYNDDLIRVIRIPSFSSIYSKPKPNIKTIESEVKKTKKSVQIIKNNKFRITIISILNSIFYGFGSYFYSVFYKPNYVWANDLNTLFVAFLISKTCRAKLIYDSHEIFTEGLSFNSLSSIEQYFLKKIENRIIKKTDAVIVTTDLRAEYLSKKYSLEKVWTIMNCHRFINISSTNLFRKEFSISESSIIFLYQGSIHRKRGIFTLVDAINEVDNTVLIFLGDGADKQKLYSYIRDKKLRNKIFIKDAVPMDSLIQYTASADVGFQLLTNSGFNHYSTISNKVFEYIMAEIPIIASNFPELKKIIVGNEIGLIVNPANLSEIVDAIKKMECSSKQYLKFRRNLKNIKKQYTWENEEKKIIRIIKEL